MTRLDTSFPAHTLDNVDEVWGFDLDKVAAEFPEPDDPRWQVFKGAHEPLKRQGGPDCWGPETVRLILALLSPAMCSTVAQLLGYPVLVGDTWGGGYHLSGPGAHLDVHRDFNREPHTKWRRRANLIIYLNRGWRAEWGGCLELDHTVTVVPEMGRLAVFETSERSWHGHPVPIADGHWRKSVAVYYYDPSDAVPDHEVHDTEWYDEVTRG